VRTPNNGVLGTAEILGYTALDERQRRFVDNIYRSGTVLLGIVNAVLDYCKAEAGKVELTAAPFDLAAVVSGTVAMFESPAQRKGLSLHLSVDPGVAERVTGDAPRVQQVLTNLIGNAIKFTTTGSVRVIVTCAEHQTVHFEVRDTGIGVHAADHARIFEPFVQADNSTTRRYDGTGLGLAIARQLVAMMDGEIGVESVPGGRASFWFTARLPAVPAGPRAPARQDTHAAETGALLGVRVLVAEDHPINRDVVEVMLDRTGCELTVVENGEEAVRACARADAPFDVVLMDWQMPVMDGCAAARAIRAWESATGRHVPIIALTANAMQGDRDTCFASGMDDFLSKPFSQGDLLTMLQKWSAHGRSETDAAA
jgi:CheY-like chemotaxis protein